MEKGAAPNLNDTHIRSSTSVVYAHYVRTFAAIAVVIMHSTGESLQQFRSEQPNNPEWLAAITFYSLLRWASPFFIMISGAFLLNPKKMESISDFLKKRFTKVVVPFLFWAFIYITYDNRGAFVTLKFPDWGYLYQKVVHEDVYYHLWFISMILSLYFLTPIFRIFTRHASRTEIEYFLGLAFVVTTVQHFVPNVFTIKYVGWLGYIGFYVLGYYLSTFAITRKKWIYGLALLMPVVTFIGSHYLAIQKGSYDDKVFVYFSPNVVLISFAFYLFIKDTNWSAFASRFPRLDRFVHYFSDISFGIYFVHVLFIDLLKNYLPYGAKIVPTCFIYYPVSPFLGILLQAALVLTISFSTISLLKKIPFIRRIVL